MAMNLPLCLISAVVLETISFSDPFDPRIGVMGWLTTKQIGLQVMLVCGRAADIPIPSIVFFFYVYFNRH